MVRKRFLAVAGLAVLIVLGGRPLLNNAEAQQSAPGVPGGYRTIEKRIRAWNAAHAVRVAQINALTARKGQRELARAALRLRRQGASVKQDYSWHKAERQVRDPFALPTHGASALPRHLSPAELAQVIRRKMAERTITEARRAARSRRSGFNGLYPGWSITPISRA